MMQIFIAVFGLDGGEFFYLQLFKLATVVSKLPQYTLHLFSQSLTLHYRNLVRTPLSQHFEMECYHLKEYLNVLIHKLGVKELYDNILFYVESYTHLEKKAKENKQIEIVQDKFEVSDVIGKVSRNLFW